jgi:PAS domain S-box-containing protein
MLRSDGTKFPGEVSSSIFKDTNGVDQSSLFIRDISERKRVEEALKEDEERLALVLEGSQLGYWDWNIETGEVYRNSRWAEMLGYTMAEIEFTVKQWTDLHHPDDRVRATQAIQNHLDGKTPVYRIEYRMRTKDGSYKWVLDQAKIVRRDAQGKPLRMCGTHTDITERKQAEELLRRHIEDADTFASPSGIRSLSCDEKMYNLEATNNPSNWLGPIWLVVNYVVFRGLLNYGYRKEAETLYGQTLRLLSRDLETTGELHEYYVPETGEPVMSAGFLNWNMLVVNMAQELGIPGGGR